MGSGKTVLTAFLVDELIRRNKFHLPQPKVCYCYCRDDESGKALYILSTLLLSLLEQFEGLKRRFHEWCNDKKASGYLEPAGDRGQLEIFIQETLSSLDRPLFLVIDGLDECDRQSRGHLLGMLAVCMQNAPLLKVALSTRPDQEILEQIGESITMHLVSDVNRDSVIVDHAIKTQLPKMPDATKSLLVEHLSRFAEGSAIWVKMTIKSIEDSKIRAPGPMRDFLKQVPLPDQLFELYEHMLSQSASKQPENLKLAHIALTVLAGTRRALSILELSWVVALAFSQQKPTSVAALSESVDEQRVLMLIRPFIRTIDFEDLHKRQVRLVHQSVKEYVLRIDSPSRSVVPDVKAVDAEIAIRPKPVADRLEAFMLDLCMKYLLLNEINTNDVFSEEQLAISEMPQEHDLFKEDMDSTKYDVRCTWEEWEEGMIRYDPAERGLGEFFVYASCYWLEHFGLASVEYQPSLLDTIGICYAGSVRLHNWTRQSCRPDCVIQARFAFNSSLFDPLGIVALHGPQAMLYHMLDYPELGNDGFLSQTVPLAADHLLREGDLARVPIFFIHDKAGPQLWNIDFFEAMLYWWSRDYTPRRPDWNLAFDLLRHVSEPMVHGHWANDLLRSAARAGCLPMIHCLIDIAEHDARFASELLENTKVLSAPGHQSIGEAILGNHLEAVQYLLAQKGIEVHLQYSNASNENVLHLAAQHCNPSMFRLLVPRCQDLQHQKDRNGRSVLFRVALSPAKPKDRLEVFKLLLSQGSEANNNRSQDSQQDLLRMVVRLGDVELCSLLMGLGGFDPSSVLTHDNDGHLILMDETDENRDQIPGLLRVLTKHFNSSS